MTLLYTGPIDVLTSHSLHQNYLPNTKMDYRGEWSCEFDLLMLPIKIQSFFSKSIEKSHFLYPNQDFKPEPGPRLIGIATEESFES